MSAPSIHQQKEAVMPHPKSPRFLIAGAPGRHGATAKHAARQLLAMGLLVRVLVRQADDRADELNQLGAEIAVGDLRDYQSVRVALDGVQRAYFTYPLAEGLLEATAIFAAVAKQTGLQSVVNMSQITARPDHPSPAARQHWLAERVLDWSGIGVTHLRPPFFLENLTSLGAGTIRADAKIYLPYGDGRHAPVGGEDCARVAVGILTNPAAHHGKTYIPTGPASLSMAEMADVFTDVLGRPVHYVDIPVEPWRQVLNDLPGMSPFLIEHLSCVAVAHQRGEMDTVTDAVETIGGTKPMTVEDYIAANRTAFDSDGDTQRNSLLPA
jgi:NAD(P)H dehydrogenase (quinone)